MKLRVTTANCENLFGRYKFLDQQTSKKQMKYDELMRILGVVAFEPGRSGKIKPTKIAEHQRKTTAAAILEAKPDILAVEEVENIQVLRLFNDKYMKNYFNRIIMIDGNDPRGIDVGLLIRDGLQCEVLAIRSHADDALAGGFLPSSSRLSTVNLGKAVFSRDCLEVDVQFGSKVITFLVNHFKAQDGKPSSTTRRKNQSERVLSIAKSAKKDGKLPIVMGDLNIDVSQKDYDNSLNSLYNSALLTDPFKTIPDHWTHFYASKKSVSRLDYLLIDADLENSIVGCEIMRKGLSPKCKQYTGPRLATMKGNNDEASDHCPTTVVLNI